MLEIKDSIELMPHQDFAVEYIRNHKWVLLSDDMGLGKTLSAIASASNTDGLTLVVCPSFLKFNWAAEYDKFTEGTTVKIIKAKKDIHSDNLFYEVVIISYAMLKHAGALLKHASRLIFDEAHALKNIEAIRTQAAHVFLKRFQPEMTILITGTPMKTRVADFYSLLRILSYCPEDTNGSRITDRYKTYDSFAGHFSNRESYTIERNGRPITITNYSGIRNEKELKLHMRGKYLRRESIPSAALPELLRIPVYANYGCSDNSLQKAWEAHINGEVGKHISTSKAKSALAKAKFSAEFSINIKETYDNPVVIYTDHIKPLIEIVQYLKKKKFKVGEIQGSTPLELRQKYVEMFQKGLLDFLVCTIGAASTGLTLTAASDMVMNDVSWDPMENAQVFKRIHRIGQTKNCRVHCVVGSKIDERIIENNTEKIEVFNKIVVKSVD